MDKYSKEIHVGDNSNIIFFCQAPQAARYNKIRAIFALKDSCAFMRLFLMLLRTYLN
jgi:hypothetical protein